jgi:plastocyanin
MKSPQQLFHRILLTAILMSSSFASSFAFATPEVVTDDSEVSIDALFNVNIPGRDQFVPFGLRIRRGDVVRWTNNDGDEHIVASVNAYSSPAYRGARYVLSGTATGNGRPGVLRLRFPQAGTFIYYCSHHARLDGIGQPIAPGPMGGIPGTPMMGVITVLP